MESISNIKDIFNNTPENKLQMFIEQYKDDSRQGVANLVKRAAKKIDDYNKEIERTYKLSEFERKYSDYEFICGIDEVGRGPLAGPVVAGAVILPKDCDILYINDSKKLSAKKREELYEVIMEKAVCAKTAVVSPKVIDEINILQATYEAMREAISKLDPQPDLLLNDAVTIPQVEIHQVPIIKGDAKSISIGAASIIAKVTRDRLMVEYDKVMPELKDCHFRIACDVTNPLCGENGSTYIYGPQKGVTVELRDELDHAMGAYAQVVKAYNGTDYAKTPGAGAAGGLGFAFLSFLSGELLPGIELVLNAVEMDKAMEGADLVFTGEGRLDYQTAMGKAPVGIAKMAKKHGAKVIALAGAVIEGAQECNEQGIDAYFPILRKVVTLDEAMEPETAKQNMIRTTEQIIRLVAAVK